MTSSQILSALIVFIMDVWGARTLKSWVNLYEKFNYYSNMRIHKQTGQHRRNGDEFNKNEKYVGIYLYFIIKKNKLNNNLSFFFFFVKRVL